METEDSNVKDGERNLRRRLALAVRSIQWSYAVFWSISSTKSGMLEWCDGYYNGDIKTRKTMQTAELNADELGLHRSEQLRELYESLSAAESNPQAKRPSTALSPEDLTDTEWYYLVCMSFEFNIGQGLPGMSLSKNETIWLYNAQQADSKTFLRSLLAKSASVQTVVCFPYLEGVVEFGVTDLVLEDQNLIQHVKTSFLDNPLPEITKIPYYMPTNTANVEDSGCVNVDEDMRETEFSPVEDCQDLRISSPYHITNGSESNQLEKELNEVECIVGVSSQVEGSRFMDEEISNSVRTSMNPSDYSSETHSYPITGIPPTNEKVTRDHLHELHKSNQKKLEGFDFHGDDVHYQNVVSAVLKSSYKLILGPDSRKNTKGSGFVRWKRERMKATQTPRHHTSQRMLKKVLFEVARMHVNWMLESVKDDGKGDSISGPEADDNDTNHVWAERKRREKLNERIRILGSLVPSTGKVDKVSILDDTIEYIKELERRIEELESCREVVKLDPRTKICHPAAERISENCFINKVSINKMPLINKRKAREAGHSEPGTDPHSVGESSRDDLKVSVLDKNVLIAIKCPWREYLLNDIMEAIGDLNLETRSVQSFNSDGTLSLTLKSQFKASKEGSPSIIRQTLHRVIHNY